jgi:hypothetical protein
MNVISEELCTLANAKICIVANFEKSRISKLHVFVLLVDYSLLILLSMFVILLIDIDFY